MDVPNGYLKPHLERIATSASSVSLVVVSFSSTSGLSEVLEDFSFCKSLRAGYG